MIFKGIHGTCVSEAQKLRLGNPGLGHMGRVGSGFYLWAYDSSPEFAIQLAKDWYAFQKQKGVYEGCTHQGFDYLDCEINVPDLGSSYANLNQTRHHELLRSAYARLLKDAKTLEERKVLAAKVFDQHITLLNNKLQQQKKGPLWVVEAMVAFPNETKSRDIALTLTPGADAYILQARGFEHLNIAPARIRPAIKKVK